MNWLCKLIGHKWYLKRRCGIDGLKLTDWERLDRCARCGVSEFNASFGLMGNRDWPSKYTRWMRDQVRYVSAALDINVPGEGAQDDESRGDKDV